MEIQQIAVKDLIPAEYNPRKIADWEMRKLMRNIETYGFLENIVVNKDMTIVSGHQRVEAAKSLGLEFVPAYVIDVPKDKEKALNIAMNRVRGDWDEIKLADLVATFTDEQKLLSGMDEAELAKLVEAEESTKDTPSEEMCPACNRPL